MNTKRRPVPLGAKPTVTVVIPHFNYGEFLPFALASALGQGECAVDVIIVDDASTDGSAAVARELAEKDDRVALIEHAVNRGHIASYNEGLAAATGKYVVLLSADDALAPGSLARSVALMEAEPSVGLVYGDVRTFEDHLPPGQASPSSWAGAKESWTVWRGGEWLSLTARRGRNVIMNPEVVMRRDVLASIGGYDARFPHSADLYLWLRAAARADVGRVNGTVQAFYRVHRGNMHSVQFGGLLDDYSAVRDTFDTFFREDHGLIREPAILQQRARRAIGREAIRRTVLLPVSEPPQSVDALLRFAAESDPDDRVLRSIYRRAIDMGLRAPLRGAGRLRWKVRYQRELRSGL
ncbi:glycosyltransferase family 2 protein [Microbacterium sp. HJ5]